MKKNFFLVVFILLMSSPSSINAQDSNAKADSIIKALKQEEIFEKVKQHEELVKRLEWTSPWFLIPTIIAVAGIGWTIYLYFKGIQDKVNTIVKNDDTKLIIKNQIDQYFKEKVAEEEKKRVEMEQKLKSHPVYLIFHPEIDQKTLFEFLKEQNQFTSLKCVSINDSIQPETGDVILFVNEKGELKPAEIVEFGSKFKNQVKFFYYNTNNIRWENKEIQMSQFANNKETLVPRLLELLAKKF